MSMSPLSRQNLSLFDNAATGFQSGVGDYLPGNTRTDSSIAASGGFEKGYQSGGFHFAQQRGAAQNLPAVQRLFGGLY